VVCRLKINLLTIWHGFKARYYINPIKMKKQTINNYAAPNFNQHQFKGSSKNVPAKKNPRYIYTEEDLGEGILDVGVTVSFAADQQDSPNRLPWISMIRSKVS
jgi:hypothetical protein